MPPPPPTDDSRSSETTLAAEAARTFFALLEKLGKVSDLYGWAGPMVQRAALDALAAAEVALGGASTLELRVQPHAFLLEDTPVYQNEEHNRSLAMALYRDGVRRLSFHRGVQAGELLDFLRILRADLRANLEESVVTLLWARNFRGLSYHAIEDFFQTDEAFSDEPHDPDAVVEAVRQPRRPVMGGSTINLSNRELEGLVGRQVRAALQDLHKAQVFDLQAEEIAALRAELEEPTAARRERFIDVVMDLLRQDDAGEATTRRLAVLARFHAMLVAQGDFRSALLLVQGLQAQLQAERYSGSAARAVQIQLAVEALPDPAMMRSVLAALRATGDRADVLRLLRALGPAVALPLATALEAPLPGPLRTELLGIIEAAAAEQPDLLHAIFALQRPPVELVGALACQDDPRVPPLLIRLAAGLEEDLALAAIRGMAVHYQPQYTPILLRLLDEAEESVRLSALRTLGSCNEPKVADLILRRVRRRGFKDLDAGEKRAHFLVVVLAAGDKALPQLRSLLDKRGWLRRLAPDVRQCALHAVGTLASAAAAELLEREAQREADPALRQVCSRLAAEVRRRLGQAQPAAGVREEQTLTLEESTRFNLAQVRAALDADGAETAPPPALSDSARHRIQLNHQRIQRMNHYEVLGLTPDASDDEIRAAHQLLTARFSGERYRGQPLGGDGQRLEEIRQAVDRACLVLLDPASRRAHDAKLAAARRSGGGRLS